MTHSDSTDSKDSKDSTGVPDSADSGGRKRPSSSSAQKRPAPATAEKKPNLVTVAALVIALIAVGLAVVGWFRPSTGAPSFNDDQTAEAKANICEAFNNVSEAVVTNTHRANPVEGDPVGALSVAANARLALYAGGGYLQDRIDAEPATPAELTEAIKSMSKTLEDLGIGYMAGLNSTLESLRNDLNSGIENIRGLCA